MLVCCVGVLCWCVVLVCCVGVLCWCVMFVKNDIGNNVHFLQVFPFVLFFSKPSQFRHCRVTTLFYHCTKIKTFLL